MLEVRNLDVYYGEYQALKQVSLQVFEGEIVCLLGTNGSGKSTLMNSVSGLIPATRGDIFFRGARINNIPTYQLVERGLVHVLERRRLFPYMTVLENLLMGSFTPTARARRQEGLERVYTLFPLLKERRKQLAQSMSGGEQQILAMARGLMAWPTFLMLDEPFLGLAPKVVAEIVRTIRRVHQEGVTILFTEQNIRQSLVISQRGYILENGEMVLSGTQQELLEHQELKTVYLGI